MSLQQSIELPTLEVHSQDFLRVRVPDPEDAALRIRGAHLTDDGVLVPWTLPVARRLSALRVPVISRIAHDYDWPSYKPVVPSPMPHQIKAADFLVRNPRSFLLGDIGTGKTLAALWAADYLMEIGEARRALVVCPKSIVNESWGDSLKLHFRHRSYTVLVGAAAKRRQLVSHPTDVHIVNFEGVGVLLEELARNEYDLVVVDESTAIKNVSTARWKTLNQLTKKAKAVWLLTGTPTPQRPTDAYGQAKLVDPNLIYRTSTMFKMATMVQVTDFKWVPRKGSEQTVQEVLSPALHIDKRKVLADLPPVTSIFRQVDVTPGQRRAFERMRQTMQVEAEGTKVTAANAAVQLCKLVQILAGTVYDDNGDVVRFDNKPRINEMLRLLEQSRSKSIVYVPFLHVLESVAQALDDAGVSYALIYGGVPLKERERIFKSFQTTDEYECLLAIPNAMAHGVTATAASTVVWFMPQSRHEIYTQATGRVDRKGQRLPVTIAHLYGDVVEKRMYEAQQDAADYARKVLALYHTLMGE